MNGEPAEWAKVWWISDRTRRRGRIVQGKGASKLVWLHRKAVRVILSARATAPPFGDDADQCFGFRRGFTLDPLVVGAVCLAGQQSDRDHRAPEHGGVTKGMFLQEYLVDVLLLDQHACRKGGPDCPERQRLNRLSGRPAQKATRRIKLVQGAFHKPMVGWCWRNAVCQPAFGGTAGAQVLDVLETRRSGKHIHQREV